MILFYQILIVIGLLNLCSILLFIRKYKTEGIDFNFSSDNIIIIQLMCLFGFMLLPLWVYDIVNKPVTRFKNKRYVKKAMMDIVENPAKYGCEVGHYWCQDCEKSHDESCHLIQPVGEDDIHYIMRQINGWYRKHEGETFKFEKRKKSLK